MALLARIRDTILIIAGVLVIIFILQSAGIPLLPTAVMRQTSRLGPEQALAVGNLRDIRFSERCVRTTLGDQAFSAIGRGDRTFTEEEKKKLAPCVEDASLMYADTPEGVMPGVDYGITLPAYNCTKGMFSVTIENLPKTGTITKERLIFKMNGWKVPCDGFPPSLAAGQIATCTITRFVVQGYNELQIDAPELGTGTGAGIECR